MEKMNGLTDHQYLSEEILEHGQLQERISMLERHVQDITEEIARLNADLDVKDGSAHLTSKEAPLLFVRIEQLKPLLTSYEREIEQLKDWQKRALRQNPGHGPH